MPDRAALDYRRDATLRQCVIAAETPDAMLEVAGRPFIAWLMREMLRFGVDDFIVLSGHVPRAVEQAVLHAADALPKPVRVRFSGEPQPAGSGGALFQAAPLLAERFLMCNGNSLFDCNVAALLAAFAGDTPDVLGRLVVREDSDTGRHGAMELDGDRVTAFAEHSADGKAGPGPVGAAIIALDHRVLGCLTPPCSLDRGLLAPLARSGALRATRRHGWFVDIGIPAGQAQARRELAGRMHRQALFLDRDGVLNVDHGYVGSRDRWEWVAGAREAVSLATSHGWHVFVVTNQAGIARGLYGEADLEALQRWVADELRRSGGTLDDWRYCPYHTEARLDAYRRESDWRKPAPGMLLDLIRAWDLDPRRCLMVGDKESDMQAASRAGMSGRLFRGGNLLEFIGPAITGADP